MANISIWPGSSSFFPGDTPFGFYDTDTQFQSDADKVADWCARRLGYPLVDIELQTVNFFTCFEEAINEYGSQLYHFQIVNNFHTLEGTATGGARIDIIDQKSTELSGDKIFYGELVQECGSGDTIQVDVEFTLGGVSPFPSDTGNRPIEITFERIV